MSDETLFTLRQLAEQLSLPESTIRYYRDAFIDQIPSVGTGRRRKYPPQAVAVLRSIAKSYASGRSRAEIIAAIHERPGAPQAVTAVAEGKPQRSVPMEEVTNLDLLAAILDGEREQRDALWQMAKEIVRLTDVLEGQDKVLGEIADQAGVTLDGQPRLQRRAAPQLQSPTPPPAPEAAPAAEPPHHSLAHEQIEEPPRPSIASSFFTPAPSASVPFEPAVPFATLRDEKPADDTHGLDEIEPLPRFSAASDSDMERLRSELENERALVERLRESKLQLEHRAADAEAALEERNKGKRPSVIRRLLGGDGER
jgi:DNA-binding transcriptional MerR regulator